MIGPTRFIDALERAGVRFVAGVPDSLLRGACRAIEATFPAERHVVSANEGGAVALAAGQYLATGAVPLVYLQNSGLGNAVNPLASLVDPGVYAIPLVLLIGWRGEPGLPDEPQHGPQGRATLGLLDALAIPYRVLDGNEDAGLDAARWAVAEASRRGGPVALVARRGTFADLETRADAPTASVGLTRAEAIAIIADAAHPSSAFVASTGMIGRELAAHRHERGDALGQDFLSIGSMGHASQIALGIALARPERLVVCLDGDGAALMHLGGITTIGTTAPRNLLHVVLNNGVHDSVGGQPTGAWTVDLPAMARAAGYPEARTFVTEAAALRELVAELQLRPGPSLLEVRVVRGGRSDIGRPTDPPTHAKDSFAKRLRAAADPHLGMETAIERAMHQVRHLMHEQNVFEAGPVTSRTAIYRPLARRRDLALGTFGGPGVDMFTVRSDDVLELFKSGMSSRVPAALLALTSNKQLTKVWLSAHGVPVARGGVATDAEEGMRWFEALGRDVVVKPILGTKGRGISVGLRTEPGFRSAFAAAQEFNRAVVVEETIRGIDLRVVVIGDRTRAAVWRIPANVIGDGTTSIDQLVAAKNRERSKNVYLAMSPLRLDTHARRILRDQGLTVDSVPAAGRRVYLTMTANITSGGDSVNVLEFLHPSVIAMVERAAATVGQGLYLGFDVLLERLDRPPDEQRCVVCELNSNAGPNSSRFPTYGPPVDVADAVLADLFEPSRVTATDRYEAAFTVAGIEQPQAFETWLRKRTRTGTAVSVEEGQAGLHLRLEGRVRHVEQVAESCWRWRGTGSDRAQAVHRTSKPTLPASSRLPPTVRPLRAPQPPDETLAPSLASDEDRPKDADAALLAAAFMRQGWTMHPQRPPWYVIENGTRTGLCFAVQACVATQRLARLRFPLLRWLSDAGVPTPRHAAFTRRELDAALEYLRRKTVSQRLRRAWERARWCQSGVDEAALTAAWQPWPRRLKALILEDEVPGAAVGFLVVAGRAEALPLSGQRMPHPTWSTTVERVAATLPSIDLALVWLRVDDPAAVAETVGWTVVDVDPEPALHRFAESEPGAAAAAADRVVRELYLTGRTYWFDGNPSSASDDRT